MKPPLCIETDNGNVLDHKPLNGRQDEVWIEEPIQVNGNVNGVIVGAAALVCHKSVSHVFNLRVVHNTIVEVASKSTIGRMIDEEGGIFE